MKTRQLWVLMLLLVALVAAGCHNDMNAAGQGNVRFVLSAGNSESVTRTGDHDDDDDHDGDDGDDAVPMLQSANVTFSSLLARNQDGELIDVMIDLPVEVDVLALLHSQTIDLPMGVLPMGTYDQLVIVMTKVVLVTSNGTEVAITPPGGGWTVVVRICPFMVGDGDEVMTTVALELQLRRSFRFLSDGFHFMPRFECDAR